MLLLSVPLIDVDLHLCVLRLLSITSGLQLCVLLLLSVAFLLWGMVRLLLVWLCHGRGKVSTAWLAKVWRT